MSRIHYVPLPDSDTEIIEEVTYRRKTTRGMKIKQERTPMEQPLQETTGKTSRSRSKNKRQAQLRQVEQILQEPDNTGESSRSRSKNQRSANLRHVEEPLLEPDSMGYLEAIEDEGHGLPEPDPEGMWPRAQTTMSQWPTYRGTYLNILLEMEGRTSSPKCSMCSTSHADIKCSDCFGANLFCKACCLEVHKRSPFHRTLGWTGNHYAPISLYSLGFLLCLGHNGEPCPKTVEGVKAAASRRRRTKQATSFSLPSVQEDIQNLTQLPTPRETPQPDDTATTPSISDTLYDFLDIPLDPGASHLHRTRTGKSGNPYMTIVDCQGVLEMEVLFCACSDGRSRDEQLLRAELFPATFKQIETLFTFAVLDNFLTDNLECKTTAQQYYSKLQSMTSNLFPDNVSNRYKQLLRASRQWRDLKNRMKSGLGHASEQDKSQDGSIAIFCPACPQPGLNLPDDWKKKYSSNELVRTFIMDGNFSAEHMRYRTSEKDIALSPGMAFMANPDLYKSHLRSGAEMAQPNTCNTYRAIEQANSSRPHLDVTGIGATACCHGFFIPTSVVDFQKGERQINMDYSICKALSYNMEDIPVALVMYDIMCQYRVNFKDRIRKSPELSLPSSLELRTGIGLFHIHGHQDSCLPRYSPSFIPGAKQVDGEIIETLWAPLNNISRSLRGMSLAHRQEVLDAHMNHSNWKKLVRIVPSLLKRWKRLDSGSELSAEAFVTLSKRFKEKTKGWLKADNAAQQTRHRKPEAMDIYDTAKEKAPSRATIQQQLISDESGDSSIHGQTSWISSGLKIQEMQLAIKYQLRTHGSGLTSEEAQVIDNKRSRLQKLIEMFEHQSDSYLLRHKAPDNAPISSLGDYSEFDNVDNLDASEVPNPIHSSSQLNVHSMRFFDGSGMDDLNPEDISILLPSSLGWEWCVHHSVQSLAKKEAQLRHAQANDAIHSMRLALGFKSALFRDQVRQANTQRTKTRAWDAIHSADTTVHQHARNYSMARDAYLKIQHAYEDGPELPQLRSEDLRVSTAILGAAQVGQRNTQLPWIWSFGATIDQDGTWMDEFDRVHWLRAKAQFQRWMEEQASIHNEAEWVPAYFHAKAEEWKALMMVAAQQGQHGHEAYASQQMHSWEELSNSSKKALSPITSAPLRDFKTASLYLT